MPTLLVPRTYLQTTLKKRSLRHELGARCTYELSRFQYGQGGSHGMHVGRDDSLVHQVDVLLP